MDKIFKFEALFKSKLVRIYDQAPDSFKEKVDARDFVNSFPVIFINGSPGMPEFDETIPDKVWENIKSAFWETRDQI